MYEWIALLEYDRYATIYANTFEEAEDIAERTYGPDFIEILNDAEDL